MHKPQIQHPVITQVRLLVASALILSLTILVIMLSLRLISDRIVDKSTNYHMPSLHHLNILAREINLLEAHFMHIKYNLPVNPSTLPQVGYLIDRHLKALLKIQDEAGNQDFHNRVMSLEQKTLPLLKPLLANNSGYFQHENTQNLLNSINLILHQLLRLHQKENAQLIEKHNVNTREDIVKILASLGIVLIIGVVFTLKILRSIRKILQQQKETENQLRELNENLESRVKERTHALETSNRELEAYSYSIAHDLRTPLRSIVSFSQLVKQDAAEKLNEEESSNLQRVIRAGQHMAELIDDILALGRVSRLKFSRKELDLSAMAEQVIKQLQQAEPDRSITVDIEPGLNVQGDPQLVEQLLTNLLGNAWKYTRLQSQAHIEFKRSEEQAESVFVVRDNGVGFDPKYAGQLFKPFHRLHQRKDFDGSGIGLATVQRIIQRHGGRIWAKAEPGKGAEFFFTFHA